MKNKEIINLIETRTSWDSSELIKAINNLPKKVRVKKESVKFFHIGGYELLRDGTQTEKYSSIENLQEMLEERDISYDKNIKNIIDLANSVEKQWEERYDDGGGSGWIEY